METVNYELVKGEIDYDMVLFVVEDHKNDEPDRCYNCHPNHEFEHTLTPHF